jgi:hypothetical protein
MRHPMIVAPSVRVAVAAAALAAVFVLVPAIVRAQCVGDCDANGTVTIADLITGVNIALGNRSADACPAFQNGAGHVDIAQLIKGVNNALRGCGAPAATATATATVPEPTATVPEPTGTAAEPTHTATGVASPPPATPTNTARPTPSLTPTPSAECAALHACELGGGSQLYVYAAAYQNPVLLPIVGSTINVCAGRCAVDHFVPVPIAGVGVLCMTPAAGCPDGGAYCGPGGAGSGPALGVDVESDGLLGAGCASNAECSELCDAHCTATDAVQLASGCTGFCSGSAPAEMSCITDQQCVQAQNGNCNGPDQRPLLAHKCQCTCVNRSAFGGSTPGDFQCNLGVEVHLETAAPCDGADVIADYGTMCIPFSTQQTKGQIADANFTPGASVPLPTPTAAPNVHTGTALACSALAGGNVTGLQGYGAFTLFSVKPLGDLSFALRANCK